MASSSSASHQPEEMSKNDQPLPALSPAEFRRYNKLAERMDAHHNHFRQAWKTLSDACAANKLPRSLTKKQFLRVGIELCEYLNLHHDIEEQYIFPHLSKRMSAFAKNVQLVKQHRQIHAGLEKLAAYMKACERGEKKLSFDELKEILDGFGEVLWTHLDEEVRELGAERMRRFWTLEEVEGMPF